MHCVLFFFHALRSYEIHTASPFFPILFSAIAPSMEFCFERQICLVVFTTSHGLAVWVVSGIYQGLLYSPLVALDNTFTISVDVLKALHAFQWVSIGCWWLSCSPVCKTFRFPLAFSCTDLATTRLLQLWLFISIHLCFQVCGDTLPFGWLVNVIYEFWGLASSFRFYVGIWRIKRINLD